jgi:hypothetical protein
MQHYFFTVPAQDAQSAQAALNRFCVQHHVLRIDKELVADGANTYPLGTEFVSAGNCKTLGVLVGALDGVRESSPRGCL